MRRSLRAGSRSGLTASTPTRVIDRPGSRDKEYDLLHQLALAEGRVLGREEIYQRVWGYTMAHGDRSVDVFVRKLRHKLDRVSPGWRYVHTHFGVGYRFAAERTPADEERARPEPAAMQGPDLRGTPALAEAYPYLTPDSEPARR